MGVPINNIVFVKPTETLWSDACGYGIGGYSNNILSWKWIIPSEWNGKLTLNLLEFLASEISIYVTILQLGHGSHILSFTDSSSTLGFMYKASFYPINAESHNDVSRWLSWNLVINKTYLYSQHIKVTENIIADSLSSDFHISNQTLTKKFNRTLPPQTATFFCLK